MSSIVCSAATPGAACTDASTPIATAMEMRLINSNHLPMTVSSLCRSPTACSLTQCLSMKRRAPSGLAPVTLVHPCARLSYLAQPHAHLIRLPVAPERVGNVPQPYAAHRGRLGCVERRVLRGLHRDGV